MSDKIETKEVKGIKGLRIVVNGSQRKQKLTFSEVTKRLVELAAGVTAMKKSFVVTVEGEGWFDMDYTDQPNDASYLKGLIEYDAREMSRPVTVTVTVTVKPLEGQE